MARQPRPRKQPATMGTGGISASASSGGTTASVSNVVNTGTRSVSQQTTGSTGSSTNTVNRIEVHGTPGTPGREVSAYIDLPSGGFTHPDIMQPGMTIHAPPEARGPINDALDHAETQLTDARSRIESALSQVPSEYQSTVRQRVDDAFNRGHQQIQSMRGRIAD